MTNDELWELATDWLEQLGLAKEYVDPIRNNHQPMVAPYVSIKLADRISDDQIKEYVDIAYENFIQLKPDSIAYYILFTGYGPGPTVSILFIDDELASFSQFNPARGDVTAYVYNIVCPQYSKVGRIGVESDGDCLRRIN